MKIRSKSSFNKIEPANLARQQTGSGGIVRRLGLAAIAAGALFIFVQVIHPEDALSSVGTASWTIVHILSFAMSVFGLFGVTGIQAAQAGRSGWLSLAGYLAFSLFWVFSGAFQFAEAFVYPVLATESPAVVEALLGMVGRHPTGLDLGMIEMIWSVTGFAYLFGGLLTGIGAYRAGVLPHMAGGLLAAGTLLPLFTVSLVPHPYDRILAVPVGLALVWLGYSVWSSGRREAPAGVSAPNPELSTAA